MPDGTGVAPGSCACEHAPYGLLRPTRHAITIVSTVDGGHYPALSPRGRAVRPDAYAVFVGASGYSGGALVGCVISRTDEGGLGGGVAVRQMVCARAYPALATACKN